jgi:uncharacterized membrane protein YbaN (DUF454 family)
MRRTAALAAPARIIFGGLGWCAVLLAAAGIVVPGLPTTVFVIAASYCFSRSSPRFEQWLLDNQWLGPRLHRFRNAGGMSPASKRAALAAMWMAVLLSSGLLATVHVAGALVVIGMGAVGTLAILFGVRTVPQHARALMRAD